MQSDEIGPHDEWADICRWRRFGRASASLPVRQQYPIGCNTSSPASASVWLNADRLLSARPCLELNVRFPHVPVRMQTVAFPPISVTGHACLNVRVGVLAGFRWMTVMGAEQTVAGQVLYFRSPPE